MPMDRTVAAARGATVACIWPAGTFGKGFAMLNHAFQDHPDNLFDMRKRLFSGVAPSCGSLAHQKRAFGVPAISIGFYDDVEV